ncbi:hypothetical protein MAR_010373 [Mya arenaria]|uniref:Uncharacterized protein n=1 Tax=Mya arenaria TaxID=6604 RepID=A0ABY7E1D7_MYAAR|nr:hypothetical protein MAR_010373 [Mya arenaria]
MAALQLPRAVILLVMTRYQIRLEIKICSNECKEWKPKQCWDGYLKRNVWKMVCEKNEITCCPGFQGPQCEDGGYKAPTKGTLLSV